ncbi:MAG: twin-arginine translocation signal domain-containing protein [Alphaproteobacteria bacterium]|nr:twin-arginine translocation signal domain-containing protein [Alphaproteobacteria bacterium]MDX5367880.1 twin-arginine translocation signal domain-containing protein [Alphaproteobacteria bacterium]MDX5462750.1 twin-arginine translocation signal domain-containing protein [Alphaproteobacteria bacterium]
MNRRDFLKTTAFAAAGMGLVPRAMAAERRAFDPNPENGWRTFEVTTRIEPVSDGAARVWVSLPSVEEAGWIRPMGNLWNGNAASVREVSDPVYGARMLAARWEAGEPAPVLEVVSRFATRDRAVDLGRPGDVAALDADARRLYTKATRMLPTDGIVREAALEITQGAATDLEKARAIYDWIVDNTERNPKTRGCGLGDIRYMLETGDLTGKCADLNALYVGLARAAGLPARDVYGVRVADSRYGYRSLGKSGDVTKGQHCRAEVWLAGFGWVPVDPADVRKVVLEEAPGLTLKDDVVKAARETLFGAWEMNWLAYNVAHDLALPGSEGADIPFFMYPEGEDATGRFDNLEPGSFAYTLTSRELTV